MKFYKNKLFTELDKHELLELANSYISEGKYSFDDDLLLFEHYINNHFGYGYVFKAKDVIDWWESEMFSEHVLESYYEYKYL